MATVITVHGTYAHIVGPPEAPAPAELQWWQPGSACEQHIRQLVHAGDGDLNFMQFTWSGDNSEQERRAAGSKLLAALRSLEERKESYCLIGHSHGGSVIAWALVASAAKGQPLDHLKKWITVGTPFVALRKERFLFSRLTLPRRVVLVASLMLLMMFLFYLGGQLFEGTLLGGREGQLLRLIFSGALMSLPLVFFYAFLKILDARSYYAYRPAVLEEAQKRYGERWLALNHDDDEAVQGLKLLPRVKLNFFNGGFAVPFLTLVAIFALPLAYLYVVTSPTLMVAITDLLKTRLYGVEEYRQSDPTVDAARQEMSALRRKLRQARQVESSLACSQRGPKTRDRRPTRCASSCAKSARACCNRTPSCRRCSGRSASSGAFWRETESLAKAARCAAAGTTSASTARYYSTSLPTSWRARSWTRIRDGARMGGLLRLWLPILLVPVVFAFLALGILMLVQFLARRVSVFLSRRLNLMTHHEITRSALGNDTDGEIALGSDDRPAWMSLTYPYLPGELANKISDYSNEISFKSLAKFRNAISTLAFATDDDGKEGLIMSYLTWRELIHTSYFEVPQFRKLLAYAIGQADGFAEADTFKADPDFDRATRWYGTLKQQPPLA